MRVQLCVRSGGQFRESQEKGKLLSCRQFSDAMTDMQQERERERTVLCISQCLTCWLIGGLIPLLIGFLLREKTQIPVLDFVKSSGVQTSLDQ